jgi:hypothetical protein
MSNDAKNIFWENFKKIIISVSWKKMRFEVKKKTLRHLLELRRNQNN